jgi:signal transduction histidine kinase/ActR/RegA family two-component response regulator
MAAKTENSDRLERRVLVLMPTGRDAELVCGTLGKSGIYAETCADVRELEEEAWKGAGAVLVAEEALHDGKLERLIKSVNRQPVWSDLPFVLFAGSGPSAEALLTTLGSRLNATIVERPIRITMLVSAVHGALRAREKQYQTRDLLNQLEESDRQKDLFLATLSHELRTPLNSVLGWIRLLKQEDEHQIDKKHALEVIERNAKAQAEMVSDILFVSRVITGKLTLKMEPVDLISVIEETVDVVRPSIEAKNINLDVSFEPGIDQIKGDADRLQQVFWNLLSNAIKFTPVGGDIHIRARGDGRNVKIEICDSGKGIKEEFLPFVFERFRQSDNSYTREVGGLGLGLAIVRHLVELHGGTVSASSDGENCGAAFTVSLPAVSAAHPAAPAKPDEINETHKNEDEKLLDKIHLLIVEDDTDSREMLKIMFSHYDMRITAVASAAEGFDAVRETRPDILISDVGLPGEDGYSLIQKVRGLTAEQGGQLPAIALTGYASLQDRRRALEAGYQEHLSKPVDIDALLELVKKLLTRGKSANPGG